MTLLERWDKYRHIGQTFTTDEVRRAIAIEQAWDEYKNSAVTIRAVEIIEGRADELLRDKP